MTAKQKIRHAIAAAAVVLVAAPAALAFFAEASKDRAVKFLEDVRAAQERVRYAGRKVIDTPEGQSILEIRADRPGRPHVESVARPSGRRGSGSGRGRGRFTDPALIAENYRLESGSSERIAGRDADRYALVPRHKGRASYEFAVDRQTRFVLAFRAVAVDGSRLYDARFESIEFDPVPKADEEPAVSKPSSGKPPSERPRIMRERVKNAQDLRKTMPFTVWSPSWTPPGFKLRSIERQVIRNRDEAVLMRWSDGMVGIHVIQTDANNPAWELFRGYLGLPETPPAASASGGPVAWRMRHPGGALLDLTLDGTEVLIGGQVDPDELKKMADHLRTLESPSLR